MKLFLVVGLLLLGTLVDLCITDNPCDVHSVHSRRVKEKCNVLYNKVEKKLMGESINLYTLRETFHPTNRHPPGLLIVKYNISVDGLDKRHIAYGWSGSNIYSILYPGILMDIQSPIITRLQNDLGQAPKEITLYLSISSKDWDSPMFNHTMEIITSRASLHAPQTFFNNTIYFRGT